MTPPDGQTKRKDLPTPAPTAAPLFGRKSSLAAPKPYLVAPAPTQAPEKKPQPAETKRAADPLDYGWTEPVNNNIDYPVLSPHVAASIDIIRTALKQTIDARQFSRLKPEEAAAEIRATIEQIALHSNLNLSAKELDQVGVIISDEMLGFGPIEPLLARQDISEIMVNGPDTVYIEVDGLVERSAVRFRDSDQLVAVCQRIANKVGRRVDESSPMCDARLPDGSRVNIILPPLAIDGAALTIRKFKRDKLTLDKLLDYGSISPLGAEMIRIIAACRTNIIVSGGTGSGKTTMLNCLTRYIHPRERIVTCEDSAELQLQQPHIVRLETRPANAEGIGEVTMRDLVKNCLRMRPERIIVGEVRGPEAFDLLQAMNTGHDGSMGTVHANSPREAVSRLENMIAMNRLSIPAERIREQIAASVNVIIQVQRLRDGSRKVTNITEITGMEGEVVTMQDLMVFEITGEDERERVTGEYKLTGLRPRFHNKLREFGLTQKYDSIMERYFNGTASD